MTVYEAVVVMSSTDGALPRMRMFNDGVIVHGVFRGPAGLFMAEMTNTGSDPFFSEMEQGNLEVGDPIRLNVKQDFPIENNWPSRKVLIDGEYYAIARNFAPLLHTMITNAQAKQKRKRR